MWDWFTLVYNIVLTFVIYLAYPFSRLYMYGKSSNKKGTRIALLNVTVCSIIYVLMGRIIAQDNYIVISIVPAVVYYFISKCIMVDKNLIEKHQSNFYTYCNNCKNRNTINDKFCSKCGKSINITPQKYSADAIIGFVISMVGIFISGLICGIVGVFFSVFALKEIKNKTKLNGKGLAIAGLVISIIDIVSVVLYMIKILALIL